MSQNYQDILSGHCSHARIKIVHMLTLYYISYMSLCDLFGQSQHYVMKVHKFECIVITLNINVLNTTIGSLEDS